MADSVDLQEIKTRADIVGVVSRYVKLKKAGRTFTGLCPFHPEKTPSFHVNPAMGIFKCFGCGKAGDVIGFIKEIEHLEFPQAVEKLADELGISIKKSVDPAMKKLARLREIQQVAADFYTFILTSHTSGKDALKYAINNRKLTVETIEEWKIGYAPRGSKIVQKWLLKKGYTEQEIRFAGLVNDRGQDKYEDRLMFPIVDVQGRIVGFSGRTIRKDDIRPKYLNSAESELYRKRYLLFGLNHAKDEISKKDMGIICEGQIDSIVSIQAGVKNIVAPLGTGLTDTQLTLLSRYSKKVAFCFDNDSAGQKSMYRGVQLALAQDMQPYIITLPLDVNDIDDLIQKRVDDWVDRASNPKEFFEVQFLSIKSLIKQDPTGFEQKLHQILETLSGASELKQGIVAKQCADILGLSEHGVLETIQKKSQTKVSFKEEIRSKRGNMNTSEYVLAMITMFPLITYQMGKFEEVESFFIDSESKELLKEMFDFSQKHKNIVESVYDKKTSTLLTTWDQVYLRFNNELALEYSKFIAEISERKPNLTTLLEKMMFSELTSNISITNDIVSDFFKTWGRMKIQTLNSKLNELQKIMKSAENIKDSEKYQAIGEEINGILVQLRELK